ncbi:MAG: O-antigen ligase family protein [Candidatus Hodarchaeota archaeon]
MKKIILFFLIFAPLIDFTYLSRFTAGPFVISPNRIFKVLPIVFFVFYYFMSSRKVFIWKYMFYFMVFSLLSTIIGLMPFFYQTVDMYIRLLSSFIFIFWAGKIVQEDDIYSLLKYLTLITLVPITLAYLQFLGYVPYTDFDTIFGTDIGRVSGGYEKQVALMSYLIYGFSFSFFSILNFPGIMKKVFYIVFCILCLGVVVLSSHRASMLIFAVIIFYFLFMYSKKLFVFTGFVFIIIILNNFSLLKEVFVISAGIRYGVSSIFRGRFGFWLDYMNRLIGSGIIAVLFGKGNSVLDTNFAQHLPYLWNEPHGDYMRILYQYGVTGFILYLIVFVMMIMKSILYKCHAGNIKEKLIGDMGIIIGLSLLLFSVTIEPTRYPSFWWVYSVIFSFILVNKSKLHENSLHNKPLYTL